MNLWAPWRMGYVLGEKYEGCILCDKHRDNEDERNFVVERGEHCYVMLNLYPYSNGHLMIAPYRHIARLQDLNDDECREMMTLAQRMVEALSQVLNTDAFNLGLNQGRAAGAGIDEHLHLHVVPRWEGDTNFMPVLGGPKVIPQALEETYRLLRDALKGLPR